MKILFSILFFFFTQLAFAQEKAEQQDKQPPYSEPPKLELAFEDGLDTDTRTDYKITGDVKREKGKLTLNPNSTLQRELINAGPWVELEFDLEFPKLTQDGETSGFKVWLDFEPVDPMPKFQSTPDSFVWFRQKRENGKVRAAIFFINTTGNWDREEPELKAIRKPIAYMSSLPNGKWKIIYRCGSWSLIHKNKTVSSASSISALQTPVSNLVIQNEGARTQINNLKARASRAIEYSFSQDERSKIREATKLNGQVVELYRKGQFQQGIVIGEKALALRKRFLGAFHPNYTNSLHNLALLYKTVASFEKAESLYVESKTLTAQLIGKEHASYALSLNNLAGLYVAMGAFEKAEPLFVEAKEIYQRVLGKENAPYALCISNLALVCMSTSSYERAEALLLEAKNIRAKVIGKDHLDYAVSLNGLATFYRLLGAYEDALPLQLESVQIVEKNLGKNHPTYALSLNNLAGLYDSMGTFEKAGPLFNQSKSIIEKTYGKKHPQYAMCLVNLAGIYRSMAAFEKAETLCLEAKEVYESTLGKTHPDYASCLNTLALTYHFLGAFDKAESLLLETKQIREKVLGKGHPSYSLCLNSLGMVHLMTGANEKAKQLFLEVKSSCEKKLGKEHPDYALSVNNLALAHKANGELEEARSLFQESVKIFESVLGPEHPDRAQSLRNLAFIDALLGSKEKAESLHLKCMRIDQSNFQRFSAIQSESQQLEYQKRFSESMNMYLSLAAESADEKTIPFELSVNWKGQIQLRQSTYRVLARDKIGSKLFSKYRSISQQLFKHFKDDTTKKGWKDRLKKLTDEKESIEKELAARSTKFAQSKEQITVKQIQDSLPPNAAFVNFHVYQHSEFLDKRRRVENRLLAFVVGKDAIVEMLQLGEIESINNAIETFRTQFDFNEKVDQSNVRKAAFTLRNKVWIPIQRKLGGAKNVFISPDGQLGTLPFAALPGTDKGTYLIDKFNLLTIPVPQLLSRFQENRNSSANAVGDLLVIGDVSYDEELDSTVAKTKADGLRGTDVVLAESNISWPRLKETSVEIESIRRLFQNSFSPKAQNLKKLSKSNANESSFREHAPNFRFLHIATHGFFAPSTLKPHSSVHLYSEQTRSTQFGNQQITNAAAFKNTHHPGLLSGLVFAGANVKKQDPNADDGIMTADEISALPLSSTDLVTLSACETGLGKTAGGEGLIGIQRAFQISGARSTIASLWKVDDLATRKLMERFYRNLIKQKMTKLEALSEAQRWLLNNPRLHSDIVRGRVGKAKNIASKKDADNNSLKVPNTKRLHPRYWAAWVLSGDWK